MVLSSQIVTEQITASQSEYAELHFSTHMVCVLQLMISFITYTPNERAKKTPNENFQWQIFLPSAYY